MSYYGKLVFYRCATTAVIICSLY